jgi:ferric-dicitrate binding protein FerR (iron transport regulator)
MDKYYSDKTFLARWLANELTEEELSTFQKTDAYRQFKAINQEAQNLVGPTIDSATALRKVHLRLNPSKTITLRRRIWVTAIAASIALLIGTVVYLNTSKTYSTQIGEKQTIALSDGSMVYLNANSSLSHNRMFWSNNRQVELRGEGYFTISKGKDFKVTTSKGTITVLGTRFNVFDRSDFDIQCYEGSIRFRTSLDTAQSFVLKKGMQISVERNKIQTRSLNEEMPSWKSGVSKFKDQPLSKVLDELENQYPIKFQTNNVDTDRMYTGEFVHNNLKMALEATLTPMGITYSSPRNTIIVLSN